MVTEYIPINYGNAEDIAKLLTDEAKSGWWRRWWRRRRQHSAASCRRAAASVSTAAPTPCWSSTSRRRSTRSRTWCGCSTSPVDQVVIEARIVIANESFARELGAKFGISGKQQQRLLQQHRRQQRHDAELVQFRSQRQQRDSAAESAVQPDVDPGLNVNLPSTLAGAGSLALSILNAGYALDMELSALQTEGRGEVISNPRIVTSNQKEAVIRQGQEVGYLTIDRFGSRAARRSRRCSSRKHCSS